MSVSLPPYPNSARERLQDTAGIIDKRLLLSRLIVTTAVGGLIAFCLFILALVASMGQILHPFDSR